MSSFPSLFAEEGTYPSLNFSVSKINAKFKRAVLQKKEQLIQISTQLSGQTTQGSFDYHTIWTSSDNRYEVSVGKFGKEYYQNNKTNKRTGIKGNNQNDMKPSVFVDGQEVIFDASFKNIFDYIIAVSDADKDALRLLGCLFVRNAFLEDHSCEDGKYHYTPPQDILDKVIAAVPTFNGIDTEVYLRYVDIIAWNEDVKYWTLEYDLKKGPGRQNNMLTYAHIAAVLLGESSLSGLCMSLIRGMGVAPITLAEVKDIFTELNLS